VANQKDAVRCRLDGHLEGVYGPLCEVPVDRGTIAGAMGWQDSGAAVAVIDGTMRLLREGKAVKLTSHHGWCVFQPLAEGEDGRELPASRTVVYGPGGEWVERQIG
jgi:hypothetical protein